MNFREAKKEYLQELRHAENVSSTKELIQKLGTTTIRCGWVDYVDYIIKNHEVSEKIAYKWGQVL